MVFKKLSFYGDSLMIPRPGWVTPEERHPRLLELWLRQKAPDIGWEVLQRARGSHTITEIVRWTACDEGYYAEVEGGIAVIHAGIVDGAPRPINSRMREMVGRLPGALKKMAISFLHHQRSRILRANMGSVITPLNRFQKSVRTILGRVTKTHDHVFVITICPTNAVTEIRSPGLTRNIIAYNDVWVRSVAEQDANIQIIDAHAFISAQPDIDLWVIKEDGHHITAATHSWIAQEIIRLLEQRWQRGGSPPP
jgi:hypothetical protein